MQIGQNISRNGENYVIKRAKIMAQEDQNDELVRKYRRGD